MDSDNDLNFIKPKRNIGPLPPIKRPRIQK